MNAQNKNDYGEDLAKIQYLCNELKKLKTDLPLKEKLEELQKIATDLEIKYESLYELSNFFDPLYVKISRKIHEEYVKKLRENNRKKNNMN